MSKSAALVVALAAAVLVPATSASADIRQPDDLDQPGLPRVVDRTLGMDPEGVVKVRLACPRDEAVVCRGTARLSVGRVLAHRVGTGRERPRTSSESVSYRIEPGARATLRIRLTPVSKWLVDERGPSGGRLSLRPRGGTVVDTDVDVRRRA